jgi:hypothetical protein
LRIYLPYQGIPKKKNGPSILSRFTQAIQLPNLRSLPVVVPVYNDRQNNPRAPEGQPYKWVTALDCLDFAEPVTNIWKLLELIKCVYVWVWEAIGECY